MPSFPCPPRPRARRCETLVSTTIVGAPQSGLLNGLGARQVLWRQWVTGIGGVRLGGGRRPGASGRYSRRRCGERHSHRLVRKPLTGKRLETRPRRPAVVTGAALRLPGPSSGCRSGRPAAEGEQALRTLGKEADVGSSDLLVLSPQGEDRVLHVSYLRGFVLRPHDSPQFDHWAHRPVTSGLVPGVSLGNRVLVGVTQRYASSVLVRPLN